jgi:positive phototaxis protein PixI
MQQPNSLVSAILSQLAPETDSSTSGQKYLRFLLASQAEVLLPLEQISAVLSTRFGEILPIPEMPSCVMGIYNWRGKNLWLIDIGHLVDYPPLVVHEPTQMFSVVVIQLEGLFLGLVTCEVKEIELHHTQFLEAAQTHLYSSRLLSFSKGYLPSAESLVLDIDAIARFPLWQVHRN